MESINIKKKRKKKKSIFYTHITKKKKKQWNNSNRAKGAEKCILRSIRPMHINYTCNGLIHRGNIQFARSSCVTTHYEERSRSLLRLRVYNIASTL